MTLPLSTDTRLTADEESWIRAAFSWSLLFDEHRLAHCLDQIPEPARIAAACAADRLLRALLPTDEVVTHG